MKTLNITPVFKKGDRNIQTNNRPVSILPKVYKIYEGCLYKQMSKFFDKILSKYQCGFRKRFSFAKLPSNYVREMVRRYRQRRLFWGTLD